MTVSGGASWLESLAIRRAQGLYRHRYVLDSPQNMEVVVQDQRYLNFCSNDYLGLANDPRLIESLQKGVARYGLGAGASHLICGHFAPHHALEEDLAAFTGRERALLFSTGYMANLGVIAALAGTDSLVLADRLDHASLLDGVRLSGARWQRYRHGDSADCAQRLEKAATRPVLIVTDGVFSMDGDCAPLPELAALAERHRALLMVDDAHGLGVLGDAGRGTLAHHGLGQREVPILIGTLGKAFGTFGAFVAGAADLIEWLIQRARTYIYTTALPPALAEATRTALQCVMTEEWRRVVLRERIAQFRVGAEQLGLPIQDSLTPIQILMVGDNQRAVQFSEKLREQGIWVSAIRPPTVPVGQARLRITFSAAHRPEHVERLLAALASLYR